MADKFDEMANKLYEMTDIDGCYISDVAAYLRAEFGKEWIPVSERFPEIELDEYDFVVNKVIGLTKNGAVIQASPVDFYPDMGIRPLVPFTHWQEFPKPTKGEQTE